MKKKSESLYENVTTVPIELRSVMKNRNCSMFYQLDIGSNYRFLEYFSTEMYRVEYLHMDGYLIVYTINLDV